MAREIKFRVWDKVNRKMYNPEVNLGMTLDGQISALSWQDDGETKFGWQGTAYSDGKYELMQYTGLKDNYSKEIYEGDIVRYCDYEHEDGLTDWKTTSVVWCGEYDYPAFDLKWHDFDSNGLSHIKGTGMVIEVIGNIYESPELLQP